MPIKFDNKRIPCGDLFESPRFSPVASIQRTQHFFGLDGEVEIGAGRTGRDISIRMWIHDPLAAALKQWQKLHSNLLEWENLVGSHGTLEVEIDDITADTAKYSFCTLRSVERNNDLGPIKDTTGMLSRDVDVWWQEVTFTWRQLLV